MPDELWDKIKPLMPSFKKSPKGGRPRKDMRSIMEGIFYVLRTGCQWKMMPKEYPSGSTCHRYFQYFEKRGVFDKLWKKSLIEYNEKKGIHWKWQSGDSHTIQSPVKGGR
jgi:transposase